MKLQRPPPEMRIFADRLGMVNQRHAAPNPRCAEEAGGAGADDDCVEVAGRLMP